MIQNNLSLSKLLGVIIASPAALGIGGIVYNLMYININNDENLGFFIAMIVIVLMFLIGGIGLYFHKLWGRAIATSSFVLVMIGLIIMLVAVAFDQTRDLPILIGFVTAGLLACSSILLLLYNHRVTQELLNNHHVALNNEILDSHLH